MEGCEGNNKQTEQTHRKLPADERRVDDSTAIHFWSFTPKSDDGSSMIDMNRSDRE